jgi:rhodanese-related sulfurtransferase
MGAEKLEADRLSPEDARKAVATGGRAATVDLRDQDEFSAGHIPGAVNIPADELDDRLDELSQDEPVIVVCDEGKRSAEAAERLRERGYEAASVDGGMRAWSGDSLPLQPAEDEEFHGPRRPGPLGE